MDTKWEIVLTIGTGIIVALLLAHHKGATGKTSASLPQQTLPQQTQDASMYDPSQDVANGVDLSGVNFNFPIDVTAQNTNYSYPAMSALSPVNMSMGTPQCGCSSSAADTSSAFARAQQGAYNAVLAALAGLGDTQAALPISLTVTGPPEPDYRVPGPAFVTRVVQLGLGLFTWGPGNQEGTQIGY